MTFTNATTAVVDMRGRQDKPTGLAADTSLGDSAAKQASIRTLLAAQRDAFLRSGPPSAAQRRADLSKLANAILAHRQELQEAIDADFGHRSAYETAIMELTPTLGSISHLRGNLKRWMRPRRRRVSLQFLPGAAKVVLQPLGVVGIISPWNYPASLSFTPLATALAAGNRAMLKPSEFTPRTSALIASILKEEFLEEQVAVVTGGADIGEAFAALPFDHLLFTGSTKVGRAVMRAASANLVPLTLELGGKSPAIVARGFPPTRAARSIAYGKLSNAGQTCIAPDYALVHESEIDAFVTAFEAAARAAYPAGLMDEDYSAIINPRHYERLRALVEDARKNGARILEIGAARGSIPGADSARKLPPTLIVGATPDMAIMQEEIFGPLLPIVTYKTLEEAIAYVNARPRPLALYVFSDDREAVRQVLERTTSGNATVNDTLLHYGQEDLPFGGVGASGMGAYHGEEGFVAMSHAKGIFTQSRWNLAGLVRPPFGPRTDRILNFLLG